MHASKGGVAFLRASLSFASVLFTVGNSVSNVAGGDAVLEAAVLAADEEAFEEEVSVACSLDELVAGLRGAAPLLRLTCSKRSARSASVLRVGRSEAAAFELTAVEAVRVVLGTVLLVNAPFLRGAAGAGIVDGWSRSKRPIAFFKRTHRSPNIARAVENLHLFQNDLSYYPGTAVFSKITLPCRRLLKKPSRSRD